MKKSTVKLPDTNTIIRYLIKDDVNQYLIAEAFFANDYILFTFDKDLKKFRGKQETARE